MTTREAEVAEDQAEADEQEAGVTAGIGIAEAGVAIEVTPGRGAAVRAEIKAEVGAEVRRVGGGGVQVRTIVMNGERYADTRQLVRIGGRTSTILDVPDYLEPQLKCCQTAPLDGDACIAPQSAVKSPSPRYRYHCPQFGLGNRSQCMKKISWKAVTSRVSPPATKSFSSETANTWNALRLRLEFKHTSMEATTSEKATQVSFDSDALARSLT